MLRSLLGLFWLIRTIKNTFFFLYLWQLKEYHLGRFISHFDTEKGRRLISNPLIFLKIVFVFLVNVIFLPQILLVIYIIESTQVLKNLFQKKLKLPVLTKKIIFLTLVSIILEISYFISIFSLSTPLFIFYLLAFDILTLAIISGIVLFFQPLAALARLLIVKRAIRKRAAFKDLIVIGITGSYGKTSTKEFLSTILSEKFKVLKTKEHQNSEMGVSQCILNELKSEHQVFVVEMGAYNKGGIKLLCDIAKPKIGILTGINEQHLATFGSEENIIQGKYELIESLPKNGTAIFNGDNNYCFELYENTEISKRLSISNVPAKEKIIKADAWAENIIVGKDSLSFKVFTKDGESADFKVNLSGGQNVENILMAVIAAKELGMNLNEISQACQKIKPEQGGMRLIKNNNNFNIIDSTYSSNPNGVIANLEYLKLWQGNPEGKPSASYGARKVIIMPCLIELGKAAVEVHKRIGEKIGQICDLAIITTKDYFEEIKDGSTSSPQESVEALFIEDPQKIFEKIKDFNSADDIILLQSRVPKELIDLLIKPH
jgi:UDP-N-acetylmuramoyl-tripeptide--D-alanyl-D-alanine ligase